MKPKVRVYLYESLSGRICTGTVEDDNEAEYTEEKNNFKGWISDWIEYDMPDNYYEY